MRDVRFVSPNMKMTVVVAVHWRREKRSVLVLWIVDRGDNELVSAWKDSRLREISVVEVKNQNDRFPPRLNSSPELQTIPRLNALVHGRRERLGCQGCPLLICIEPVGIVHAG